MGDAASGSGAGGDGRRRNHIPTAPPQNFQTANRYPSSQYRNHNLPPPYYQYPGYYPPPIMQPPFRAQNYAQNYNYHRISPPLQTHMNSAARLVGRSGRRYPFRPTVTPPAPNVEHQVTPDEADVAGSPQALIPRTPVPVTNPAGGRYIFRPAIPLPLFAEQEMAVPIINDVNLKKESLRIEPDEENPGQFLVSFTFDASTAGSITVVFFAQEQDKGHLMPMKESLLPPVMVHFQQGLGQKFRQLSGTGIDFSTFEEAELLRASSIDEYPLAVKAEATIPSVSVEGNPDPRASNSQITRAIFEKYKGGYRVKAVKQILWVNENRYETEDIYGIEKSVDDDLSENFPRKECLICLSEPREVVVIPCRHLCMCIGCAKLMRIQTNRCPICRQRIHRLLELNVSNAAEDQ